MAHDLQLAHPREESASIAQAARACELRCRQLATVTMGHQAALKNGEQVSNYLHIIMDCSYVAAATARLVNRYDRHPADVLSFQVQVCRHMAELCGGIATGKLFDETGSVARECAAACASLLHALDAGPTLRE